MMYRPRLRRVHIGDTWTELGLLGALLAFSVLVIHVPAAVWAGNTTEFTVGFTSFLALGLAITALGVLVTWVVLRLLPQPLRRPAACLLCGLGFIWWGYGLVFVGRMRVLDGVDDPLQFETPLGSWELVLVTGLCAVLAWGIYRKEAFGRGLLVLFNIGLGLATATTLYAASPRSRPSKAADDAAVFRFSPQHNVLLILLDGLQSDVADKALRSDPTLAAAFDGFRLFPDTLGVAPTTFLSLPALHSGEVYQPPEELTTYVQEAIAQRSFMNRFARAGYATTLVNPILDICPAQVATCMGAERLLRSPTERLGSEAVFLLDLSLFRVAPVRLKRHIYRDGKWLISDRRSTPDRVLLGNRLFEEVARRFTLNGGTPTMKFLHTMSTHAPYVLNEDCTVVKRSLENLGSQARCALRAVSTLLARLKQAGIYDTTLILVVADHGINPSHFKSDVPGSHDEWVHRTGVANPVFLLKPLHAQGVLKTAGEPVHLPDVGATLCAQSGACRMPMGVAAGTAVPGRPRRFNQYEWQHTFWRLQKLPGITTYEVIGRFSDEAAWRQVQ